MLLQGLFHRVIGQSGSMLSDWALDRNASAHGYRIAELANCPTSPYDELISCLRNAPAEALAEAQYRFEVSHIMAYWIYKAEYFKQRLL